VALRSRHACITTRRPLRAEGFVSSLGKEKKGRRRVGLVS